MSKNTLQKPHNIGQHTPGAGTQQSETYSQLPLAPDHELPAKVSQRLNYRESQSSRLDLEETSLQRMNDAENDRIAITQQQWSLAQEETRTPLSDPPAVMQQKTSNLIFFPNRVFAKTELENNNCHFRSQIAEQVCAVPNLKSARNLTTSEHPRLQQRTLLDFLLLLAKPQVCNNMHGYGAVVVQRQVVHPEYSCILSLKLTSNSIEDSKFDRLISEWLTFHNIALSRSLSRSNDTKNFKLLKLNTAALNANTNATTYQIEVPLQCMDVSSLVLLLQELASCYAKDTQLCLHYREDISVDQTTKSDDMEYWNSYLLGCSFQLDLHQKKPKLTKTLGTQLNFQLPISNELFENVSKYASTEAVGVEDVILAALFSTLSRYSQNNDITLGTFINTRTEEHDQTIGCFTNYLPLRATDIRMLSFESLVQQIHKRRINNKKHSAVTLLDILKAQHEANLSSDGIFSIGFQYLPHIPSSIDFGSTQYALDNFQWKETTSEDIMFRFNEDQRTLNVFFQQFMSMSFVKQLCSSLEVVLETGVAEPTHPLRSLNVLSTEERLKLMKFRGESVSRPYHKSVHQLFEDQVEKTPSLVALKYLDVTVTYQDLNTQANQLARFLRNQKSINIGDRVGIFLERSVQSVVAVIAAMKAGAIYVPLDPKYPMDRIQYIVEDANPKVILTTSNLAPKLINGVPSFPPASVLALDEVTSVVASQEKDNLPFNVAEQPIANLLFTSGSTGNPKGVMVLHRSIVNRICWEHIPVTQSDVFCHIVSLNFIDSIWDMFMPLTNGLCLVIVPTEMMSELDRFLTYLTVNKVTRIVLVPSFLNQILNALPDQLNQLTVKYWTTSGEAVSVELCEKFMQNMPNKTLINIYGTTEVWDATVYVCNDYFTTDPKPSSSMPIGKPLPNVQCIILDDNQEMVPFGIPGELYVAGDGIALGYWQREDLTKDRFCMVPKLNQIMYRTGDLARFLPSGDLEYLGRKDFQVKMNGFRVELGEIESTLLKHHYVKQCIVADRTDKDGRKHLVVYWVPTKPGVYSDQVLMEHLMQRLPEYMIPFYYVQLDKMPLTPNGKTDRKQLKDPEWTQHHVAEPFQGETEKKVGKLWQEVFPHTTVGATDHFVLNLHGSSLLSIQLIYKIRNTILPTFPGDAFLHAPTVRSMAAYIEKLSGKGAANQSVVVPFQEPLKERPNLFLLHPITGLPFCFSRLLHALPSLNLFYLDPYRDLERVLSLSSMEELAAFYLQEIKKVQPHGPYHFVGYSFGGALGWEIAHQLGRQDQIPLLCLIDTPGCSKLPQPVEEDGIDEYLHTFLHSDLVHEKSKKIFSVFQKMQHSYQPKSYQGPVRYIYATEKSTEFLANHHEPWKQLSSDNNNHFIITNSACNHWNVMEDTQNILKVILDTMQPTSS